MIAGAEALQNSPFMMIVGIGVGSFVLHRILEAGGKGYLAPWVDVSAGIAAMVLVVDYAWDEMQEMWNKVVHVSWMN